MIERVLPSGIELLSLHRLDAARYPLLLESVAGTGRAGSAGSALSRWDLLLIADGAGLRLERNDVVRRLDGTATGDEDFLAALDQDWRRERHPADEAMRHLPFRGGWALFLSYELAAGIEPVLRLPDAPGPLPVALALRCPAARSRNGRVPRGRRNRS